MVLWGNDMTEKISIPEAYLRDYIFQCYETASIRASLTKVPDDPVIFEVMFLDKLVNDPEAYLSEDYNEPLEGGHHGD